MSSFEDFVDDLASSDVPGFRAAAVGVGDAARAAQCWFESNGVAGSAADILAFSRMVIDLQMHLARQEEMKAIEEQLGQAGAAFPEMED